MLKDKKLTWWVSRRTYNTTILDVSIEGLDKKIKTVDINIDQEWVSEYQSKNVVAFIPGQSDSMVIFSAHFDHLGRMGKETYIAGASDNASEAQCCWTSLITTRKITQIQYRIHLVCWGRSWISRVKIFCRKSAILIGQHQIFAQPRFNG